MKHVRRGGPYYRVCKPSWGDCGDTSHARLRGARWNAPGEHGVLYLNRTVRMAALQAHENFRGEAHELFDLRPERRPHLQVFGVPAAEYVDAVSAEGLTAAGLPVTYPEDAGWALCQRVGRDAYRRGERGIACRTACPGGGDPDHEELALFERGGEPPARPGERLEFAAWFPVAGL
jgi:RES domain-containing protein